MPFRLELELSVRVHGVVLISIVDGCGRCCRLRAPAGAQLVPALHAACLPPQPQSISSGSDRPPQGRTSLPPRLTLRLKPCLQPAQYCALKGGCRLLDGTSWPFGACQLERDDAVAAGQPPAWVDYNGTTALISGAPAGSCRRVGCCAPSGRGEGSALETRELPRMMHARSPSRCLLARVATGASFPAALCTTCICPPPPKPPHPPGASCRLHPLCRRCIRLWLRSSARSALCRRVNALCSAGYFLFLGSSSPQNLATFPCNQAFVTWAFWAKSQRGCRIREMQPPPSVWHDTARTQSG